MTAKTGLGSIKTSFNIVEYLVESEGSRVNEIANELDMPKSTVYSHLRTLRDLGYVHKKEKEYRLTLRFLGIGNRTRSQMDLYHNTKPELQKLADKTGEHATLAVKEMEYAVLLDTVKGDHSVKVDTHSGLRMVLHTTAPGKAILAFSDKTEVERVIDTFGFRQLTENSITDRESLLEELETIRKQKFSFDDEERLEGMRAVAVPILDRNKNPLGSISVFGPTNRIADERFRETIPQQLLQAANVVEVNMNYQ